MLLSYTMSNKTLKDPLKSILKQQTKKAQRKIENRSCFAIFDNVVLNQFLKRLFFHYKSTEKIAQSHTILT
jgi:hypothetical protein